MTTTRSAELHNGVWTSWLPLSTAWTSQSACNSAAWARYGIQPSANFWPYIYDPAYGQSVANTPTCLPPQATQWWDGDVTSTGTVTRFSLGPVVCPGAYTTVSTSLVSGTSTSVICCPTNFDFVRGLSANGGFDGICTSAMTSGQSIVYDDPAAATVNSYTTATTTYTAAGLLIAVPVEGYNFATSTSSASQSATASAPETPTTNIATSITSNTSSAGPATSTSAQSSGLTTGSKVGIGVGVAAVALIVATIVAAVLFFGRRRKRGVHAMVPSELHGDGTVELPANRGTKTRAFVEYYGPQETSQRTMSEVDGSSRPVELQ